MPARTCSSTLCFSEPPSRYSCAGARVHQLHRLETQWPDMVRMVASLARITHAVWLMPAHKNANASSTWGALAVQHYMGRCMCTAGGCFCISTAGRARLHDVVALLVVVCCAKLGAVRGPQGCAHADI